MWQACSAAKGNANEINPLVPFTMVIIEHDERGDTGP